ncbi:hypothetical protein ACQKWADRAFT_296879 [Trichoderma austrokoningii]
MSSPQPQMVAQQQMTAEAPAENQARVSSEQPRPVEPMSVEANMRGGGEGVSLSFYSQSSPIPSDIHSRTSAAASAPASPASSAASAAAKRD